VSVSAEALCDAIATAARRAHLSADDGQGGVLEVRFGEQLHTRVLAGGRAGCDLDPEAVAAYVAKYSCKGSHEQITRRDMSPEQLRERGVPEQLVQMVLAALKLASRPGLRGIGGWVNMLGFRGHFVTKSRHYSTTLGALRGTRAAYRAPHDQPVVADQDEDESTVVLASWTYLGSGYLNPGDALLAAGVEASLRVAREALLELRHGRPPSDRAVTGA
jgi:hypothetical protein